MHRVKEKFFVVSKNTKPDDQHNTNLKIKD